MSIRRFVWFFLVAASAARADGPGDNLPDKVRPVPPPGIAVAPADRAELQAGIDELGREIDALRTELKSKPALLDLLPDVQVYHNAVRYALTYNEFFKASEIPRAKTMLKQGRERARSLREGKAPWNTATGLVVRGYLSKIDGSVQPYGLVVPVSYQPNSPHRFRLDAWFHGRGETLSELNFIDQREKSSGEFTPPHAFVLHPYGRYCNANRFAGEIDLFEAMDHVRKHYSIDENRLVVRGFSMGGAACWQFAVHYPGLWAAAAPGAGFSETTHFLKTFQKEAFEPTWYEKKLLHLYDCTDYVSNLFSCPTVAYSGELDKQKQAADLMGLCLEERGARLTHIIGPKTGHSYHPEAKEEINRRVDSIVSIGRDPMPRRVRFGTWTLRYNRMAWITLDGLKEHWAAGGVDAQMLVADEVILVRTGNLSAFTISIPAGLCPFAPDSKPIVRIDDQRQDVPPVPSDRSWTLHFVKPEHSWIPADPQNDKSLRKRHGLQGPIDDAFMDSFLMVRPTGKPLNDKAGKWAAAEMAHAIDHWRKQFRGEARVKNDADVNDADIAAHNLVLWGDPSSNKILARVADKLPVRWDAENVRVGEKAYPSANHVPLLIYPNPLNPKKYVVLNSGFTFREYDYLNNARQVPKLPDYAVVDVNVPVSSRAPGGVVTAGFFDERWQLAAGQK